MIGGQQLDRDIVFTMSTADGSALAGQDYVLLNAEVSFNPTNDQQLLCMNLNTIDDALVEGVESFFVDITTSAPQVSVNPSRATVTILDNDQPGMYITSQKVLIIFCFNFNYAMKQSRSQTNNIQTLFLMFSFLNNCYILHTHTQTQIHTCR